MTRPCPRCATAMPDAFSFCGRCGARLVPIGVEAAGERQVTCVFADISGFTSLAEDLEPEDLHGVMRTVWDALAAEVRKREGFIEKYIGDAVVAVFGAPVAHDDDPLRGLNAALGMLAALERVNAEIETRLQRRLALRVGVNTGPAMAGAVGDRDSEYGVLGDAVNVAARLQQAAHTGEILVGETTYRAAARQLRFEAHPPLLAKGKSEPIVTWRLVGDMTAGAVRARTPLVGRDILLRRLWAELAEARAGRGRAVSLVGEPGMGVSRLVQEILADPRATALRIAHVACTPYDRARPLAVLEQILRGVLAISEAEPLDRARQLLADLLPDVEPDVRALVLEMVGHPGLARPLAPGTRRRLMVRATRDVLQRIAATQPVLVLVEDAHDMDGPSRAALAQLVAGLSASRAVVLVTRRPGDPLPWRRDAESAELAVPPLEDADARDLYRAAAGASAPSDALVERCVALAEGSPAVLEELAHRGGNASALEAPTEEDLLVLRSAAVLGRSFDTGLLRAAVGADADVDAALARLVGAALLEETAAGPRFRHGGLREAVYRDVPSRLRGDLHGRVALAIERERPELAAQRPELVALHLAPSSYSLRAIEYAVRAADRAVELDDPEAAAAHLRTALDLAERRSGAPAERAAALARLAEVERLRGNDRGAATALESLLGDTVDARLAASLRIRAGHLLARAGDLERAATHLAQVDRTTPAAAGDRAELALAKSYLAARGTGLEDACTLAGDAARLARESGDPRLELAALAALDAFEVQLGRAGRRRGPLLRSLELADAGGDLVRSAELCLALATLRGEPLADRERHALDAEHRYAQLGEDSGRSRALRTLAELRLESDDAAGAERILAEALPIARASDAAEAARVLHLLGETALRREDHPAAESFLQEAVSIDQAGAHVRARSLAALARLSLGKGDLEAAAERLAGADLAAPPDCARCVAQLSVVAAEVALARGDLDAARSRCSRGLERALRAQLGPELAALRTVAGRISSRA